MGHPLWFVPAPAREGFRFLPVKLQKANRGASSRCQEVEVQAAEWSPKVRSTHCSGCLHKLGRVTAMRCLRRVDRQKNIVDAVAERMLFREAQCAVARRDEFLPFLLRCWAWSLVGECVATEVEEYQSRGNACDRVHEVQVPAQQNAVCTPRWRCVRRKLASIFSRLCLPEPVGGEQNSGWFAFASMSTHSSGGVRWAMPSQFSGVPVVGQKDSHADRRPSSSGRKLIFVGAIPGTGLPG
jgi:hypothetical protein